MQRQGVSRRDSRSTLGLESAALLGTGSGALRTHFHRRGGAGFSACGAMAKGFEPGRRGSASWVMLWPQRSSIFAASPDPS